MSMLKNVTGKLFTVQNGHLNYEIYEATPDLVPILGAILQDKFGYFPVRPLAIGLSEVVIDLKRNNITLSLGWDNWSGAYIMAHCKNGDLEIIAGFIET